MDVGNLFQDKDVSKITNQFNTSQFNFEDIDKDKIVTITNDNFVDADKIKQEKTNEAMMHDLFTLLAQNDDISVILKKLKSKYGSLVDEKIVTTCLKLVNIIGNYVITCKYNDNLGKKNPSLIKYVLFCDCPQCEEQNVQVGAGSIDGFFKDNKQVTIAKQKFCKKHNLPVLANIDDLKQEDFNQLVKRVSQIKNITIKDASKNTNKRNVLSKIAQVFKNVNAPEYVKHNNMQYAVKQANTELKANVSKKFQSLSVDGLKTPQQKDFKISKETKSCAIKDIEKPQQIKVKQKKISKQNVNMPINNITVELKQKSASPMNNITISPSKYQDFKVSKSDNKDIKIMGKDMNVAVQKQSKYVENISLKTQPIDKQFNGEQEFVFDTQPSKDNIVIDMNNSFDF